MRKIHNYVFDTVDDSASGTLCRLTVRKPGIGSDFRNRLAASACSYKRGLDLGKDPAFQARLKDPEMYEYMYGSTATSLGKEISASAKRAVYIFLASIAVIVLFASCQRLLPSYEDGSRLKMNIVIQIVMLTAAALMVIVSKASPKKAVAVSV